MGLVGTLCDVIRVYALLYGAWSTFKVLKGGTNGAYDAVAGERMLRFWSVLSGLQTYEMYLEWLISFWCPFYYELKLAALVWLVYPESGAPNWLFRKLLHPAMAVASFHLQRDIIPRLASTALFAARRLQAESLPSLVGAVRRDELKMWDRSVRGQLAAVQMELEVRRAAGDGLASQRVADPAAAALVAGGDATQAQLLRELLQPAAMASANGGISGSYKRGSAAVVHRSESRGPRRASSVSRVRFSEGLAPAGGVEAGAGAGAGAVSGRRSIMSARLSSIGDADDSDGSGVGHAEGPHASPSPSSPGGPGPGLKQLPRLATPGPGPTANVNMRRRSRKLAPETDPAGVAGGLEEEE